jgi:hypothetical protein
MLREAVVTLEEYILYATEQRWWGEIPDIEATVCAIKSELGRRGAFNGQQSHQTVEKAGCPVICGCAQSRANH